MYGVAPCILICFVGHLSHVVIAEYKEEVERPASTSCGQLHEQCKSCKGFSGTWGRHQCNHWGMWWGLDYQPNVLALINTAMSLWWSGHIWFVFVHTMQSGLTALMMATNQAAKQREALKVIEALLESKTIDINKTHPVGVPKTIKRATLCTMPD